MKVLILAASLVALSASAYAQGAMTCKAEAAAKKLAGAAQASFMKKCESDAMAKCEKAAVEKKLTGAAKASSVSKCQKDAVGT